MSILYGPNGDPISSKLFNKKAPAPPLGERYGQWAGEEVRFMQLPGGGAMAFNLDSLTLADFRQMKAHYQINSSLTLLTFMLHQMEWHIECDDAKMREFLTTQLETVWSRLVRAKSQALWAGYSPNVLQWENDVENKAIVLDKIKDLLPEDCSVNWKVIDGPAPGPNMPKPKFKVYDGIKQTGAPVIPVDSSYWYPLLMQNGDYYGQKLLKSAFQPWFFSQLMHLFANRYYERFGEPVPIGRAPYDETIDVDGKSVRGNQLMANILQQIRSRSVVVLPSQKTQWAQENTLDDDYQIEYLESQMRGADFERYMTRLDEEMSLALFTPILMMRTADVGSYNLGTQHTQTWLWMLNAVAGDWADYINKYIIRPLNFYNSPRGTNATPARIKFVRMGKVQTQLLQAILTELLKEGKVKFNATELGEMCGLTVEEVTSVTSPATQDPSQPAAPDPNQPAVPAQSQSSGQGGNQAKGSRLAQVYATSEAISSRVEAQVSRAFRNGTFGDKDFKPTLGYRRRFEESARSDGLTDAAGLTADFYSSMESWVQDVTSLGSEEFSDSGQFMRLFDQHMKSEISQLSS